MNSDGQLHVKLIHCGNKNIANPQDVLEKNIFYVPMGLFSLASTLQQNGVDVEIINLDLTMSDDIEDILDFSMLDAVGFDCHWANQSLVVMDTARLIKSKNPTVFIFLGGYTASFFAKEILENHSAIDAVVRGDGEVPIVELCNSLMHDKVDQGNAFEKIPNLAWRRSDNEVVLNEQSYVATAQDMARFEFAELDLLRHWEWYRDLCTFWTKFTPINSFPQFFLEVGRGCPYACTFCGGNVEAQRRICNRRKPVIRSVDSVIRTIKKAISFGFYLFYVCLEFEGSDEWYLELFRRIREEDLDIALAYGSWRIPSKFLIDAISESFSQAIFEISPETSNLELRKRNKDTRLFYTNAELEQCLEYIETKHNLKAVLYFGYYLPFDTTETVFDTLDYMISLLHKYASFLEVQYDNLSTDPGSLLYLYPEKYQVDIQVHNFGDYLANLEKHYVQGNERLSDLTLFRPCYMSEHEASDVHAKVQLFRRLVLDFPSSVLMLLEKLGNDKVIVDYLRGIDLSDLWVTEDAGDILMNVAEEHGVLSQELLGSIAAEHEQRAYKKQIQKVREGSRGL